MYHQTRKTLGFALTSLEPSELTFRIMMDSMEQNLWDCMLFFSKLSKVCATNLNASLHISEAYAFNAPVIATNLETAHRLSQFPSPNPKFFLVNDLEWINYPNKQHKILCDIYRHPELTLLARCEDHKRLIESCWNVKVDRVVENYQFFEPEFLEYLEGKIEGLNKRKLPVINYKPVLELI